MIEMLMCQQKRIHLNPALFEPSRNPVWRIHQNRATWESKKVAIGLSNAARVCGNNSHSAS
jgi:hypothetical protein